MIYFLSSLDTYEIAWAAADRCKYKRDKGIVNYKRVDQKRDNFATAREGLTGEWAVSQYLDIPVNLENYLGGDPGWDFEYKGLKVDVKTTRAKYLLFQSHAHFKADVAILVRYHQDFLVEILGAITRDEFFKVAQIKNLGYHDNYVVTQDQLTPIEEFKNAREHQEA
jgi:hypothetical protein